MKSKKVRVGPPKPKLVSKIRRSSRTAYGSQSEWRNLVNKVRRRDNQRCCKCGATEYLQVDHIIPVAKGGRSELSNLWTLCDRCHAKRPGHKNAKHLILHRRNSERRK